MLRVKEECSEPRECYMDLGSNDPLTRSDNTLHSGGKKTETSFKYYLWNSDVIRLKSRGKKNVFFNIVNIYDL